MEISIGPDGEENVTFDRRNRLEDVLRKVFFNFPDIDGEDISRAEFYRGIIEKICKEKKLNQFNPDKEREESLVTILRDLVHTESQWVYLSYTGCRRPASGLSSLPEFAKGIYREISNKLKTKEEVLCFLLQNFSKLPSTPAFISKHSSELIRTYKRICFPPLKFVYLKFGRVKNGEIDKSTPQYKYALVVYPVE